MKTLKLLVILSVIALVTGLPAVSQSASKAGFCCITYLNPDGTVNQATIEADIAAGADPIKLAAELVGARCDMASAFTGEDKKPQDSEQSTSFLRCCELAPLFAVAVVTAAPNVDIGALTAAVILECPDQEERVTEAILGAFPAGAGADDPRGPGETPSFQTPPTQDYQINKRDVPSPSF